MYLHAYFVGMDELPAGTPETREKLSKLLSEKGKAGLHAALEEKDPASAAAIPAGNVQRTMRALELCLLTGKPASELKSGKFFKLPDPEQSVWVYLDWEKETLHARIARRTEQIFDPMAKEAAALLQEGFPADTPALKSLGYPQAVDFWPGGFRARRPWSRWPRLPANTPNASAPGSTATQTPGAYRSREPKISAYKK